MRLFKYLHPGRTDVLRNATIRFSSPKVLNDPFELKPHFVGFSPQERIHGRVAELAPTIVADLYAGVPAELRAIVTVEMCEALSQALLPSMKLEAVTMLEAIVPLFRELLNQKFEEVLGILCLTESPTNLLMWAHYADSHKGFTLEFDSESPFFNQRLGPDDDLRYVRKVIYQDERPGLFLTEIEDFSPFLAKGRDWSYEAEWRMMMPLSSATKVIGEGPTAVHLFAFPRSVVRSVIFGCRVAESRKEEIRQILQGTPGYEHVRCSEARINEEYYRVDIHPIG